MISSLFVFAIRFKFKDCKYIFYFNSSRDVFAARFASHRCSVPDRILLQWNGTKFTSAAHMNEEVGSEANATIEEECNSDEGLGTTCRSQAAGGAYVGSFWGFEGAIAGYFPTAFKAYRIILTPNFVLSSARKRLLRKS
jgi:hypothetical protein